MNPSRTQTMLLYQAAIAERNRAHSVLSRLREVGSKESVDLAANTLQVAQRLVDQRSSLLFT